jgi:hypothetical protein
MPTTGTTYKQKATHKLNRGQAARPRYTTADLCRRISVDGRVLSVGEATPQEFDAYIRAFLSQHYKKAPKKGEKRYQEIFCLDWTQMEHRVFALIELDELNRIRKCGGVPPIALFVEVNNAEV